MNRRLHNGEACTTLFRIPGFRVGLLTKFLVGMIAGRDELPSGQTKSR